MHSNEKNLIEINNNNNETLLSSNYLKFNFSI